ncbi:hypothetical protein DAPPUDRAFT_103904 [Daphnia pulex]|uniref:Ionotropic glutamate receptor C-terminal domain-containing protein n=1 Tax=Daphnia pulex TaxID=6669 RepID=E9GKQ9_DAPPU|nr:hypothetical protein DAPPUDRAFT_103904 [Daphnia pulex]|eukprot:EFX79723.1 hypothetical protein DAPPUDRAFT_103904 [Daphnia pulex]
MRTGPDGNYTVTGSNSKIIDWLAEKLNFTVSYVLIPNEMTKSKYGNKSDIAVTLNLIAEKEIDASSLGFIPTPERKKVVDFAYFLSAEPQAMVVPRPGEEPRLLAFIRPFQSSVWLLILIASILVIASMSLFSKVYSKLLINGRENEVSDTTALEWLGRYSIYIVNILTNQGNSVPVARLSFRVLVGTWLLVAMVMVNSYSGTVISCLTVPKMKPAINTFEDLVTMEDVKLVLLADTVIAQQIRVKFDHFQLLSSLKCFICFALLNHSQHFSTKESKSGASKILGDQIRNNPDRILSNSLADVNNRMETERYAFPFLQTISNDYVASDFKKTGKCRFKTTDPITSFQFWCLTLQKDNKFTPVFNVA